MSYAQMTETFRNKAKQAKTLFDVENALADIRETLAIWQGQQVYDALSGIPYVENSYVSKLLAERDAYLERYDALIRGKKPRASC